MSDDRPVPPTGAEPTSPLPQHGSTQPIHQPPAPPPGASVPAPGPSYPPPAAHSPGGYQQPPPPAWQNPTYADYKPGTIPLRPLMMNDVFGGVVATIRGNLAATLGLGLLVTAIAVVPSTALGIWWARSGSFDLDGLDPAQSVELASFAGSALPNLAQSLVVLVTAAFMVWVIGQGAIGRRVSPAQVWQGTRRRLLPVLGTVILAVLLFTVPIGLYFFVIIVGLLGSDGNGGLFALLAFVGFFALFGWIMFIWVKTAFATSAAVLEEAGPITAIKRSWVLTRGQFWRIFGIRFLAAIALAIVSAIIAFPIGLLSTSILGTTGADPGDLIAWQVFTSALATILAGILTTPFSAGVDALLYIDQRMRKEGLDVALMRAAQGRDG